MGNNAQWMEGVGTPSFRVCLKGMTVAREVSEDEENLKLVNGARAGPSDVRSGARRPTRYSPSRRKVIEVLSFS